MSDAVVTVRPTMVHTRFLRTDVRPADCEDRTSCPVCGSDELAPIGRLRTSVGAVAVIKALCVACGHVAFSRLPGAAWFDDLYRSRFESVAAPPATPPVVDYGEIADVLLPFLEPGASLLDVGCGYGSALRHFRDRGFDRLAGLELSDRRHAIASTLGLPIAHLRAEDMLDSPELTGMAPFDAAYSSHVFEHTVEPAQVMRNLAKLVRPGGHVCIFVPNVEAEHTVQMAHYLPHIHAFSSTSLRALFEGNGFEVVYEDDALRMVGRRSDTAQRTAGADGAVERMRRKFRRDFGLRTARTTSDALLRYSEYRGANEILEPSFGSVGPLAAQRRVQRTAVELARRLGDRLGTVQAVALEAIGPFLVGDVTVEPVLGDGVPCLDVTYERDHVVAWFK